MPKRSKNKVPTQKVKHLYNSQPKVPKLSKKFIIRHRRNLKYQKIYIIRHRRCPQFRNIVKRHRRRARGVWGGGSPPGKVWWIFAIHRWAPKEQWWKQMVPVVVFFHHRFSSSSSSAAAAAAILPFFAHLPRVFAPQVWTARRRRARGVWGAAAPQVKCGECSRFTDERLKKIDKSMVSVVVFPSFFHGFFHRFPSSSSFAPPPPPSWYIYIYIYNSVPKVPKRSKKIYTIRHRRCRNSQQYS